MIRVVLVNALTLSRVPLTLMFRTMLLFKVNPFLPCITLFALIAVSDYLDGKLARKYDVQTGTGAVLDVMVDFFFIIAACASLSFRGLFPGWMLVGTEYPERQQPYYPNQIMRNSDPIIP